MARGRRAKSADASPRARRRADLVIVGGGPGGLVVASVAAQLGLDVTLIEREATLGGDCLHHGCVPSKTLLRSAQVASLMRRGERYGLPSTEPEVDLGPISDHVQWVIDTIQTHDDPERFRGYGCEVLLGEPAEFISPRAVRVGDRTIEGKRFVIATGSRPAVPPVEGLDTAGYITHRDVFALRTLPGRLAVLGGGPVGVELAQAFARLGSQVTLIERLSRLLPQEDAELTESLHSILAADGIDVRVGTAVGTVAADGSLKTLHCDDGRRVTADEILVAAGRTPNVEALGLAAAGIEHTAKGVTVDRRQRTTRKHIYAVGDVCGPYPFTHMAEHQAGIVISNAVFRFPKKADYRAVPWAIFTDPELARVGLTEHEAAERGLDPKVLRFEFKDIDRALAEGAPEGEVKLVTRKGKLLGASILGAHAGELIHELALAMQTGASIGDIAATIHAYPTLSQIHRRAVNTAYAPKLFSAGTRRLVRWINRLVP